MAKQVSRLNAQALRGAFKCVAKESSRYAIVGVQVIPEENGDATLAVTDGRKLAVRFDAGAALRPCILGPVALKANDHEVEFRMGDDHGNAIASRPFGAKRGTVDIEYVEGTFPPFGDIFPKEVTPAECAGVISLDAKLLLEIAAAVNDGDAENATAVTIFVKADNKPFVVMGNAGIGVQMPVSLCGATVAEACRKATEACQRAQAAAERLKSLIAAERERKPEPAAAAA